MASAPVHHGSLQAGQKAPHPSHIPDYLPEFPDPHTYIKTLTHKQPITEYQIVREKAASQKRDVERALTRFIAKTGETETLFQDDPYAFPLIAHKPRPLPYLEALLSKEEELATPAEDEEDRSTQTTDPAAAKKAEIPAAPPEAPADLNTSQESKQSEGGPGEGENDGQIDNPYLRTIKMPKLKGGKKHKW